MDSRMKDDFFRTGYIDEYGIRTYDLTRDYPKNSRKANWFCPICGSVGKSKARYKTTLAERVHAHLVCRCRKTKAFLEQEIYWGE